MDSLTRNRIRRLSSRVSELEKQVKKLTDLLITDNDYNEEYED